MGAATCLAFAVLVLSQGSPRIVPIDAADQLRLSWRPGQQATYRFTDDQTIRDQAPKSPVIRTKTTSQLQIRVMAIKGDQARLRCAFERIQLELDGPDGKTTFDTTQKPGRRESPEFAAYRGLTGASFTVVMGNDGTIAELSAITSADEPASISQAGEAHLRRLLTLLSSWLPKDHLNGAKTWKRREELPTGLVDLTRENSLRIVGVQQDEWTIESKIRLTGKPTKTPGPEGETVVASITGRDPGTATIHFNVEHGLVTSIHSEIEFTMFITRVTRGPDPVAVESAQSLTATSTVELLGSGPVPLAN